MKALILSLLFIATAQNALAGIVCDVRVVKGQKTLENLYVTVAEKQTELATLDYKDISVEIEFDGTAVYTTSSMGKKLLGSSMAPVPKGAYTVNGSSIILADGKELAVSCESEVKHQAL